MCTGTSSIDWSPAVAVSSSAARRIEPCERIVEIDGQVLLGVDLARKREFEGEGILLLGFGPLLARRLGLAAFAFEAFALALLLLGLDQPPREFQILGDLLQAIDRVVLEVGDRALDRVGKRRRRDVEPQCDRIAPLGLRIHDHPVLGNAVETQRGDAGIRRAEIEHRLVLQGPLALGEELAAERLVGRAETNGIFIAQNLKPIPYRIYAVEDKNDNQMYEPGSDQVGFLDGTFVAVGRIARKDHRVDLGARREDVAHRIERVALVVVTDGRCRS